MKQTAVEWLAKELYEKFEMKGDVFLFDEFLKQSKEVEKQQIEDAFEIGYVNGADHSWSNDGEKYYNETFKTK